MRKFHPIFKSLLLLLSFSCANYKPHLDSDQAASALLQENPTQTIYLIGDAGNAPADDTTRALKVLEAATANAQPNDLMLFLGDNCYPDGLPRENEPGRELSLHRLEVQKTVAQKFAGKAVFIPGNHDWYAGGTSGLRREEKMLTQEAGNILFMPEGGCALQELELNDQVHLITLDSQHLLEDWDDHPGINRNCDLKSRKKIWLELESMLKKQEGKTVILAMHHPLSTTGSHGGAFSLDKHLFPFDNKIPLPVLGTLIALARKAGGVSPQDLQHPDYRQFRRELEAILMKAPARVVVVSGHEHSLQYQETPLYKQVVSGSGSKVSATQKGIHTRFAYGTPGYAALHLYADDRVTLSFSGVEEDEKLLYQTEVYPGVSKDTVIIAERQEEALIETTIYDPGQTGSHAFREKFWGKHYRSYYGLPIQARVAYLDTLLGGLEPIRMGGGHQTKTLRLKDSAGREYNLRALEKSGVQFLQTVVLKDKLLERDELTGTLPEKLLLDFYTASHPFAPFAIPTLASAAGINHTNPQLLYLPAQEKLGSYNNEYANDLYMLEERPEDHFRDYPGFGSPDDIISTDKLFQKLREDEKHRLDEVAYLRARLFDIMIGDWDRHNDQWRWAVHKISKDSIIYRPIPRDRDQAFAHYDGTFLGIVRALTNPSRMLQPFTAEIRHLEWFNTEPLPMDRSLLQNLDLQNWEAVANELRTKITDDIISQAFEQLPREARDQRAEELKDILRQRRDQLPVIARSYYDIVNNTMVFRGTDKDDILEVTQDTNNTLNVGIWRRKKGEKGENLVLRNIDPDITSEIWIYGLGDDDHFRTADLKGKHPTIRLIGGWGEDRFDTASGSNIYIYDHLSESGNTIEGNARVRLTDQYDINTFDFDKNVTQTRGIIPNLGFNPDAGFILGVGYQLTNYAFEKNPYSSKHRFGINYHFATQGIELDYLGEKALVKPAVNLIFGAHFNSPTFTRNFFGLGNNTINPEDERGLDFNRVNMSKVSALFGIRKRNSSASSFFASTSFEGFEVEPQGDRFISTYATEPGFFDWKYYGSLLAGFQFENYDEPVNPSLGLKARIELGYTMQLGGDHNAFPHLSPELTLYLPLSRDRKFSLKGNISSRILLDDDFEFYQAAFLGGNTGLRGYRIMRFAGKESLVFGGDLKYTFRQFKSAILPMQPGIYAGYDRGRVWYPGEESDQWHEDYGGGVFLVTGKLINLDLSYFHSAEGNRFSFGLRMDL